MTAKPIPLILAAFFLMALTPAPLVLSTVQPRTQVLLDDDELLKMGREAVHNGQLDKAAHYYEEALERGNLSLKELTVVHSDLCVAYMYLERFDEAIAQCKASLFMVPNRWETMNNLGTVYLVQGDYESALDVYQRALKMKPNSRILQFNYDLAKKRSELAGSQDIQFKGPQISDGEEDSGYNPSSSDTR